MEQSTTDIEKAASSAVEQTGSENGVPPLRPTSAAGSIQSATSLPPSSGSSISEAAFHSNSVDPDLERGFNASWSSKYRKAFKRLKPREYSILYNDLVEDLLLRSVVVARLKLVQHEILLRNTEDSEDCNISLDLAAVEVDIGKHCESVV
jgi:hypothetical protein